MYDASSSSSSASIASTTLHQTRSADEIVRTIAFVGIISHQIVGSKLPSVRQALQLLFLHMRIGKLTLRDSARMVCREIGRFWSLPG